MPEKKYKVVAVEDEPMILDNLIKKIEAANSCFSVIGSAQDGEEAMSVIESLKPDILFTDIKIPKLNGLELIRKVRSKYPDIQIVIISGFGKFEYAQQAIKLGVSDYLLKPVGMDSLQNILAQIKTRLDQPEADRAKETIWQQFESRLPTTEEKKDGSEELIEKVDEYIKNNFCTDISIDGIARYFNFNPTYLTKLFKKAKGISPVKYIIMLRIGYAKNLMQTHQELNIKQIGEIVGYEDPQYFSRIFKEVTGSSPTEYIESIMNME